MILYLKVSLTALLVLAIPMFLIRAQPYDDDEMRQIVQPDGCPMPCFMGIQPDVTTLDEARTLLQTNAWVQQVSENASQYQLNWTWNASAARFFGPYSFGVVLWSPEDEQQRVSLVVVYQTEIPYGSLYLWLGGGEFQTEYEIHDRYRVAEIVAYHHNLSFSVDAVVDCPVDIMKYWSAKVGLSYGTLISYTSGHVCPRG